MDREILNPELGSVLNSMIEPVHVIDIDFRIILFNNAFIKWSAKFGFGTNAIGKKLTEVFPHLSERPLAEYKRIFETGERMTIEERTDSKKEDYYDIQRIPIVSNNTGKVTHIVTILRDVTQNILNVEALKESEQKYRSLVQTMGEGVWVTDRANRTVHVNPTLLKMLGYPESEILGREVIDFLNPESIETFQKISAQRLTEEVPASNYELKFLTKNGLIIHAKVAGTTLYNEDKEIIGSFGVISDISDEKKYQQLQERFIGITAHELRTPLAILNGYMEILQKNNSTLNDSLIEIYNSMERTIQRLISLVQSVHDLNAIRANIFTVNINHTKLDDFIKQFKRHVQLVYPNRLIFVDELTRNDSIDVRIDSNRISQVLENLVENAIKNSADDKIVSVIFSFTSEKLMISVQDYGTGIPNQQLFQLFQPFSHIPTEFSQRGTGLGLYIVKSIISSHNGRMEVFTQENKGSCFTITIPT
jgi:PAS domain S-box-containing protein